MFFTQQNMITISCQNLGGGKNQHFEVIKNQIF